MLSIVIESSFDSFDDSEGLHAFVKKILLTEITRKLEFICICSSQSRRYCHLGFIYTNFYFFSCDFYSVFSSFLCSMIFSRTQNHKSFLKIPQPPSLTTHLLPETVIPLMFSNQPSDQHSPNIHGIVRCWGVSRKIEPLLSLILFRDNQQLHL